MNEFRTKTADGYWNESQLINIVPISKYSLNATIRLSTRLCEKKGFFKRFDFQKKGFATKKKVFRAKWIAF